jgi:hypothetical protein
MRLRLFYQLGKFGSRLERDRQEHEDGAPTEGQNVAEFRAGPKQTL